MTNAQTLRALYCYDSETGLFTTLTNSRRWKAGRVAGFRDKYTMIYVDGKKYKAHRLAWLYMTGSFPDQHIDHINGDKHDNRFCNLRLATPSQNSQNIWKPRKDCVSGFKGVSWRDDSKKWHATIRLNGKAKSLGYYTSAEAAHAAYIDAKNQHHVFARSL